LYDGELQIELWCVPDLPCSNGDNLKATVQIIDDNNNKSNAAEMEKIFSNKHDQRPGMME
jgi:hypothetical protein